MEDEIRRTAERYNFEFWDFRLWNAETNSVEMRKEEVKKALSGVEQTFSVRVIHGGAWGFAAGPAPTRKALEEAFQRAYRLAKHTSERVKERVRLAEVTWERAHIIYRPVIDPRDVDIQQKIDLVKRMNRAITEGGKIQNVSTSYSDSWIKEEIINSEGSHIIQEIPRVILQSNITAGEGSRLTGYRTRIGGTRGFETFRISDPEEVGREAADTARRLLNAGRAPSGILPLVADPELTGVFVHEAIGHATEADTVIEGESVLEGRLGEKIGSVIVTIIDDPTIPGAFGSYTFDDEGVRGRRKTMIDGGILKEYIHTRETAGRMGMEPNGGARAESGHVKPLVRMSNTMLLGGDHTFEELIEEIKLGVYAKGTRGGQVDPARGTFQFNAQEAYLVERGEITKPLKDVSLSGSILDTLMEIDALEKESVLGSPGFCGKGQLVPVGDGGPHMRIKEIYVGGEG